jgi:hypothetical protein
MSLYCAVGSVDTDFSPSQLQLLLRRHSPNWASAQSVLAVPPDQSREHSRAGD